MVRRRPPRASSPDDTVRMDGDATSDVREARDRLSSPPSAEPAPPRRPNRAPERSREWRRSPMPPRATASKLLRCVPGPSAAPRPRARASSTRPGPRRRLRPERPASPRSAARPPHKPPTGPPPPPRPTAPAPARSIERYARVVLSQPGAAFPLQRLAQLYRDKDGTLKALVADFEHARLDPARTLTPPPSPSPASTSSTAAPTRQSPPTRKPSRSNQRRLRAPRPRPRPPRSRRRLRACELRERARPSDAPGRSRADAPHAHDAVPRREGLERSGALARRAREDAADEPLRPR